MNPVVGTAVLLLALMSTSAADINISGVCQNLYPAKPCPGKAGWFQMGKTHCVKAFLRIKPQSFDGAEKECQKERNGHLVSIHSIDELGHVMCTMYRVYNKRGKYWIGLKRDKKVHHVFKWTDGSGTSAKFSNFASHQPDDFLWREDCVEMNYWRWTLWNDEACWARRAYVCAIKL